MTPESILETARRNANPQTPTGQWSGPFNNNSAEFFGAGNHVRPDELGGFPCRRWFAVVAQKTIGEFASRELAMAAVESAVSQ